MVESVAEPVVKEDKKYRIKLDSFEGPLDLLLHLVKENEMDIYDIHIAKITQQYLEYMNIMSALDLDIAGEFLVMAATLMHIKSRMMLPVKPDEESQEDDPREELVRKLVEYKKFKEAAGIFKNLEYSQKDVFPRQAVNLPDVEKGQDVFEMNLFDLISAFNRVVQNMPKDMFHELVQEETNVEEKIKEIRLRLEEEGQILFSDLLRVLRTKIHVIATFLAILELVKQGSIKVLQMVSCDEIKIVKAVRSVSQD